MSEMSLSTQLRGLRNGYFDVGIALSSDGRADIVAEPMWIDPLLVAIPLGHPLAAFPRVPLPNSSGIRSSCAIPSYAKVAASKSLAFCKAREPNRSLPNTQDRWK